jgi:polyisoprenoid-binding protein YceI
MTRYKKRYVSDLDHTNIDFVAKHLGLSLIRGRFLGAGGEIEINSYDPNEELLIENGIVMFSLDTHSVWTGNETRDEHLKSYDFFWCDNYPFIYFNSIQIENMTDHYLVHGELEIRGERRPVTAKLVVVNVREDIERAFFNITLDIKRSDFRLVHFNNFDMVGDEVSIEINSEVIIVNEQHED